MRWLAYFILAYVAVGLQTGLSGFVDYHHNAPNFVLLAVIFIAINAPRDAALLGCFILGALQDLVTIRPLGLYALSYGLVAMFVISTQQIVYREHPLTHFSLALVGGLMTGFIILINDWVRHTGTSPGSLFATAVYTAILAIFVLGLLQRAKKVFAFESPRRKLRM